MDDGSKKTYNGRITRVKKKFNIGRGITAETEKGIIQTYYTIIYYFIKFMYLKL